jgi:hypothetical protein
MKFDIFKSKYGLYKQKEGVLSDTDMLIKHSMHVGSSFVYCLIKS